MTTTTRYHTPAIVECNEFRKSLITWVQNQATGKRTQAAIGKTKKHYDEMTAKAESYEFVVKYLQEMEIVEI